METTFLTSEYPEIAAPLGARVASLAPLAGLGTALFAVDDLVVMATWPDGRKAMFGTA